MPSYAELQAEVVWRTQFVPQALNQRLILPLRAHYGLGPTAIGAPGDNNHLYGRHRSRNWCLTSRYCTNRAYGTTNLRDQGGDGNWYRAIDIGITGQALYDACRRVDVAVRAGRLPGLAEWFGTFDGRTVVGWYQGRPSSSDSSHLWHFHGGWWNESANDAAGYDLFYQIFTGTTPPPEEEDMANWHMTLAKGTVWVVGSYDEDTGKPNIYPQTNWDQCVEWRDAGVPIKEMNRPIDPRYWNVNGDQDAVLQLTPEQVEELKQVVYAGAKEGAEAGAPTHDELVAAAEEGANLAEDS